MLELVNVTKSYSSGWPVPRKIVPVNDVSLFIDKNETVGLVGESGCGKSTLARCITGLQKIEKGEILFNQVALNPLSFKEWLPYRKKIQIVFQHPDTALNPKKLIADSLIEPYALHNMMTRKEALNKARENLEYFGLTEDILSRYPQQVSGGQIQRIALARALSLEPELLILDEPTSMLDVSVQAQMIQLLKKLQKELSISMLFISHDIHLIKAISDKLLIMKDGTIIEQGSVEKVFSDPVHQYTKKIINSVKDGLF